MDATSEDMESQPSTSSSSIQWSQPCRRFEFHEIESATDNFDESLVIGRGGFGKVYRGTIFNGSNHVVAAIKRLDSSSNQGAPEFWAEVEMLSNLRHCHLVSLFGYCNHEPEMILVYEFMPNGTLEDHLHKLGSPLSWIQRLNICIGAARGLHYLHTGTGIEFGVIHRDVKTSNILLHENWAAKISDFGLSRKTPTNQPSTYVNTRVIGTFGYFDPDYYSTGRLTRKSDVYAFGVVLLEVLCRKRAVDRTLDEDQWNLARWAQESIKEGKLKNIIDADIRGQISPKCLKEFVRIVDRCLQSNPKKRCTMAEAVVSLESVVALQEKNNISLTNAGTTRFGRMVDMFAFPSKRENSGTGNKDFTISNPRLRVFKFAELKSATRNFGIGMLLGRGGFGRVFLGWVDENTLAPSIEGVGIAVAVKRYAGGRHLQVVECQNILAILGQLTHPNIINLLGYCHEKNQDYLIVYEYMENRTLDHFLHQAEAALPLSWGTRLKVMIGVARALAFLHSPEHDVIHRDVKSLNILLDQDFNPKLGDFELARSGPEYGDTHVTTVIAGTFGYLDPDHMRTGRLSPKSDIYGFGVVLLETLTGKKALTYSEGGDEQKILAVYAIPFLSNKKELKKIMDPRLEQNYSLEGAFRCATLALRCVADDPQDRPSSEELLLLLEQIYAVDP